MKPVYTTIASSLFLASSVVAAPAQNEQDTEKSIINHILQNSTYDECVQGLTRYYNETKALSKKNSRVLAQTVCRDKQPGIEH